MTAVTVLEIIPVEKLLVTLNKSLESLDQDVLSIREWLEKQPHLPELPEDALIRKFLFLSKFYVETAKLKIDMYYTARSLIPEFYSQHPCSETARETERLMYLIPLPKLRPNLSRIVCWRLRNTNPENFNVVSFFCYFMNVVEIRLREDNCIFDTYVCDLEGFTLSHMTKFTPVIMKKLNFLMEKVFTMRSKYIYILNAPSFFESFISFLTKYFKPKLVTRIIVCKALSQLHETIPRSELPEEFGGSLKSLREYQEIWIQKFDQSATLFDRLLLMRVNEKLRPGKPLDNDILGIQGNFRQLAID